MYVTIIKFKIECTYNVLFLQVFNVTVQFYEFKLCISLHKKIYIDRTIRYSFMKLPLICIQLYAVLFIVFFFILNNNNPIN